MTFEKYLEDLDFDKLVRLWNECCLDGDGTDYTIYDSVEDIHAQMIMDGFDIARALFFGDVRGWNDRVYFNGYGNLESCWDIETSPIDISTLAEWLKDNDHEVYQDFVGEYGEPQPFDEWLDDNLTKAELLALWDEYSFDEGEENLDLEELAEMLEDDEHPHYKAWIEEQEDERV